MSQKKSVSPEQMALIARSFAGRKKAEKVLRHDAKMRVRQYTPEESFKVFLNLWQFYWETVDVGTNSGESLIDYERRKRIGTAFRKLREQNVK